VFDGILLMWNRRVVEKIEVCVGEYVVACSLRTILLLGFLWGFTVLISLWEELAGLLSSVERPWWRVVVDSKYGRSWDPATLEGPPGVRN